MYISQLTSTPEDVNRAQAIFADNLEVLSLFNHVLKQWKVITTGTELMFSEDAGLDSKNSIFMTQFLLQRMFQNYTLAADLREVYHEYPPVMCEQMAAKLKKLPIDTVIELVKMARQDPEHALDRLDEWMEQYDNEDDDEE